MITMWDTDSTANSRQIPGDSNLNSFSIASIEPVVATSSLPTMDSIVAGSSMTMTASDISLVPSVTGVPGLVNSGLTAFAPIEAA